MMIEWLKMALLAGTALSALLAAPQTAPAQSSLCGVNAGAPIWNGSILFTDALAADIASSGCRAVRINFRIDGNNTWTASLLGKYDTIIQNARNHDLQVLGLICYEAVSGSQAEWNANYNTTGLNPYTTEFAENAWILINRYKNDVKRFEIWNEPDCWSVDPSTNPLNPGCFYIWPKNYANILAETYKKCLTMGGATFFTDNGVSVSTGGLFAHDIGGGFSTSRGYFTNVFNQTAIWNAFETTAGRRYPWDYFGYHFYLNQGLAVSTSELLAYFNDIRAMKSNYNDPSPFLLTEFGWNTQAVSTQLQANNLRDTYNWLRTQADIVTGYWYQWNDGDGGWGLVYSIGNPKLSYYEFAAQCGVTGPPTANFSASSLTGTAPLSVQFSDLSTGSIDSRVWTFGDTTGSSETHPSHIYQAPGTYTVSLTVTGPGGSDTETRTDLIAVKRATIPPDFNEDGHVDGHDVTRFMACFTGPGVMTIPDGCETGSGTVPPPISSWTGAANVAGLPAAIASSDLIHGVSGVREAGGFHTATPFGTAGGLIDLTDGALGTNVEAVLQDYPGGDPPNTADPANRALQVRYDFAAPRDIDHIQVFAANVASPGDGRVFQNYDVEYSMADDVAFQTLIRDVTTGPFGRSNGIPGSDPNYLGATLTRITGPAGEPVALNADALRFIFYPVASLGGLFLDEFHIGETGDTDGQAEAYVSSVIKEIDVFEYTGPPIVTGNVADMDTDDDADQADFAILQRCLTGPSLPVDATCMD